MQVRDLKHQKVAGEQSNKELKEAVQEVQQLKQTVQAKEVRSRLGVEL